MREIEGTMSQLTIHAGLDIGEAYVEKNTNGLREHLMVKFNCMGGLASIEIHEPGKGQIGNLQFEEEQLRFIHAWTGALLDK
jgi:hypothetical protein